MFCSLAGIGVVVVGRSAVKEGAIIRLASPMAMLSPPPVRPLPLAARTSSPLSATCRRPWKVQNAPRALFPCAGRACQGRDGNGPGAAASPRVLGQFLRLAVAGFGLRRRPVDRGARRCRRGGADACASYPRSLRVREPWRARSASRIASSIRPASKYPSHMGMIRRVSELPFSDLSWTAAVSRNGTPSCGAAHSGHVRRRAARRRWRQGAGCPSARRAHSIARAERSRCADHPERHRNGPATFSRRSG